MAQVTFTPDQEKPPLDLPLEEAGEVAAGLGQGIRIRVQPDVYDTTKTQYRSWSGLSWQVTVADVEEGRRLREGLTAFFKLFGSGEQFRLLDELQMRVEAAEAQARG